MQSRPREVKVEVIGEVFVYLGGGVVLINHFITLDISRGFAK